MVGCAPVLVLAHAADVTDTIKFPCTVPLLPFTVEEVLLPGGGLGRGLCLTFKAGSWLAAWLTCKPIQLASSNQ